MLCRWRDEHEFRGMYDWVADLQVVYRKLSLLNYRLVTDCWLVQRMIAATVVVTAPVHSLLWTVDNYTENTNTAESILYFISIYSLCAKFGSNRRVKKRRWSMWRKTDVHQWMHLFWSARFIWTNAVSNEGSSQKGSSLIIWVPYSLMILLVCVYVSEANQEVGRRNQNAAKNERFVA